MADPGTFVDYLTADHRDSDTLLAWLQEQADAGCFAEARAAFARFRADTLAHFAAEENVLFPEFERLTGIQNGPTEVMRVEHGDALALIADVSLALEEHDANRAHGYAEALLILLQQHNLKEEYILYPAVLGAAGSNAAMLSARVVQAREGTVRPDLQL